MAFGSLLTGYSKPNSIINTIFNFTLAFILLVISMPLMILIAIVIKIQDGGRVLYSGDRLGLNKKIYQMYKFRTLVPDAEKIVGAELLGAKHRLITKTGRFLRDTRLDELPQLFNILKGDMEFLGPRPERPIVYENVCSSIRGYDKRFTVKPGLVGYSQLFTPHNTPKQIRTLIDNHFLKVKQNFLFDISLVFYTMIIVINKFVSKSYRLFSNIVKYGILRKPRDKRYLERVVPKVSYVFIGTDAKNKDSFSLMADLIDINEQAFLIYTNEDIGEVFKYYKLETIYKRKMSSRVKIKNTVLNGTIFRKDKSKDERFKYSYVVQFHPVTPTDSYNLHQYFLHNSVVDL